MLPPEVETLAKGVISYIPGIMKYSDVTHSISASYCYSTYLAHINQAHKTGMNPFPKVVAELGPGTSFGVGLAALLCGAEAYYAIDELPHARLDINIDALDQLVELFRAKEDPTEERGTRKTLDRFPGHILTDRILDENLDESRVKQIRQSLVRCLENGDSGSDEKIKFLYMHPFNGQGVFNRSSGPQSMADLRLVG